MFPAQEDSAAPRQKERASPPCVCCTPGSAGHLKGFCQARRWHDRCLAPAYTCRLCRTARSKAAKSIKTTCMLLDLQEQHLPTLIAWLAVLLGAAEALFSGVT